MKRILGMALASLLIGSGAGATALERDAAALPSVSSGDVALALESVLRANPTLAFDFAQQAYAAQARSLAELREAAIRYQLVRIVAMKRAVWLGAANDGGEIFVANVDYSAPLTGQFLAALEKFAQIARARVLLLPSFRDEAGRATAVFVAGLAASGGYPEFFARAKGPGYTGDPGRHVSEEAAGAARAMGEDHDVVDQVEASRLRLYAFGAQQATMLSSMARMYAGDLFDAEQMAAFFAPSPDPKFVEEVGRAVIGAPQR